MSTKIEKIAGEEKIDKIEDNLFVIYRIEKPWVDDVELNIQAYIRLEALPLELKNEVRTHFGLEPKLK